MLNVALTGSVGAGKSTVADLWRQAGVPVISADELARMAVEPGSSGLQAVRDAFGEGVLTADGSLDRPRLRELAFADPSARRRLEAIVHPRVQELRSAWLEERRRAGEALVVAEIPLLFETGTEKDFDVVVAVLAPPEVRSARIMGARGLGAEEVGRIMSAQADPARLRAGADFVIENDGTTQELAERAAGVLEELRKRAGGPLKLDLHLHTWGSFDCLSDPEAVLARARALGYGRIAMTDHNRLGVALRMHARHPDAVIPGEEVKTAEGVDVIGLYLREEIPKGTPALETIERIRSQGGVPYLPHPYAKGKGAGAELAEELARRCDVVETFNGRLHAAVLNERAEALAIRCGKLRSAGSDAHTLAELGNAVVEVPPHPNRADAFLGALARASRVGGTSASHLVHLASTWAKVRKKLPGGRWRGDPARR